MKNILAIGCLLFLFFSFGALGQTIKETNVLIGINKTSSPGYDSSRDELQLTYLLVGGTKSWYSNDHRLSLRKEAGLNLQYAHFDLSTGGKADWNQYNGHIISLFANAAIQARLRISRTLAFGLGPEAEILLMGQNNLNNLHFTMFTKPPSVSEHHESGFNRDYFNKPSYGIKLSLFDSKADARTSIALNLSYLWTKSESSNFYASNYTRISFVIGFKKPKNNPPADPQS